MSRLWHIWAAIVVVTWYIMTSREAKSKSVRELFVQARVHCDNKPRHVSLNPDYNMTFSISRHEC